ncbi:MAG TPA: hypothetical protein VK163_04455, partial [Opitutaceae bacterium]|nr:hypothetical protein [Opitutaceae bacterium]
MLSCALRLTARWLLALLSALLAAETATSAPAPAHRPRIVLVGDSTVTERSGWGLGFRQFLAEDIE